MEDKIDEQGRPIVYRMNAAIGVLERRQGYLRKKLDGRMSDTARSFTAEENGALRSALTCMRYHQRAVEGLDAPLDLLRAVVDAYEGPVDKEGRMRAVVKQAQELIEEYDQ